MPATAPVEERYGFHGRLTADFPSQVNVDVTEVCNLACVHCPHPAFKESEHYGGRFLEPELNARMVDEVRGAGRNAATYIRYTSEGEPLIHPKGYEMIEHACRRSGAWVTLTTNGTIMNEARTRALLEAGVHMIDISIDAHTPETYAAIRVRGNLEVTRTNVLRLIRWAREQGGRTKVVVSFVEQRQNRHEVPEFESFWRGEGADSVVVRRQHSAAGAVPAVARRMRVENEGDERRPCLYPWERVVLNPRGFLSFCPADWTHRSTVADYREVTIREVWQGAFYRGLREAHRSCGFGGHSFCGECPDWKATRWPSEGRSYADLVEELRGRE